MKFDVSCDDCNEPSKYVTGFWDGENDSHGCFYDCMNQECKVRQNIAKVELENAQKKRDVQNENFRRGISAIHIITLRRDAGLTMMQMSQVAGCSPAEYSAYEHERDAFDPVVYWRAMKYLKRYEDN